MLKTVNYRGLLSSCNYACAYCPFAKKAAQAAELAADQAALARFCQAVPALGQELTIMLLPYGEALIHSYYWDALNHLAGLPNTRLVGCQTNLSFAVEAFYQSQLQPNKLALWCSFHPAQTTAQAFAANCAKLSQHQINYCVVAVGVPQALEAILELRRLLPPHIYLAINALDGLGRAYTAAETRAFLEIDPMFNFATFKPDPARCSAGRESIMVAANGDITACNLAKVKLGNIYRPAALKSQNICRAKACNCYLSCINRQDSGLPSFFGANGAVRLPQLKAACFFDIDGTLTDASGKIPLSHRQKIQELARHNLIFVATSLPYHYAKITAKAIWPYISGGSFAEGADVRIFDQNYRHTTPLNPAVLELIPDSAAKYTYKNAGRLFKVTVTRPWVLPAALEQSLEQYNVVISEDGITGITAANATKLDGVKRICRRLKLCRHLVTVVGNSANDAAMLQYYPNSYAVPASDPKALQAARHLAKLIEIPGL